MQIISILPALISSAADILTLLDFSYRISKYLQRSIRQSLNETYSELSQLSDDFTKEYADELLRSKIEAYHHENYVALVENDLRDVFSLVYQVKDRLVVKEKQLPDYGNAFDMLVAEIGKQFEEWRVFTAWGTPVHPRDRNSDKTLDEMFRELATHNKRLQALVDEYDKRIAQGEEVVLVEVRSPRYLELPFTRKAMLAISRKYGRFIQGKSFMESDDGRYTVIVDETYLYTSEYYRVSIGISSRVLEADDFERLFAGLIADYLHYSHKVSGEIIRSHDLIENLKVFLRRLI